MLLTDPFLQLPQEHSVNVVWFTEGETKDNRVLLFEHSSQEPSRSITASSKTMSRLRGGKTEKDYDEASRRLDIWRHEAVVDGLPAYHGKASERVKYQIVSDECVSDCYLLQATAQPGTPLKILLTSDLQNRDMCSANFEKVQETIGRIDAVLINGDLVNVGDRAYDWFYGENAVFKVLQGRSSFLKSGRVYRGAPIIQNTPIYSSVGNHEVMGKYHESGSLHKQFANPASTSYGREKVEKEILQGRLFASEVEKEQCISDYSFNTKTWEEIFTLPKNSEEHQRYYAVTIGDVRVVVLNIANMWRPNMIGTSVGRFSELPGVTKDEYGFGQIIYESIAPGSPQYAFLKNELESEAFQNAKYKIVMCHWQHHSLGGNAMPAYTEPEASTVIDPVTGLDMVIYQYPLEKDHIKCYVEPLLKEAGVQLFFNAHSHIWNHFCSEDGMHSLEASCVGINEIGCYDYKKRMWGIPSAFKEDDSRASLRQYWKKEDYVVQGDPFGLKPCMPSLTKLPLPKQLQAEVTEDYEVPYVGSEHCTVFTVLDTATGYVDSYYFDTEHPESEVVHFDRFSLLSKAH